MEDLMPSENNSGVQLKALNTSIMTAVPRACLAPDKSRLRVIFIKSIHKRGILRETRIYYKFADRVKIFLLTAN